MKPDLLIVGAGPAGLALAIAARQWGMNVIVVEAANLPRLTYGQTMTRSALDLLEQLEISPEQLNRHVLEFRSQRVRWNRDVDFVADADGVQLPRVYFEPLLLQRAQELGAKVVHPCLAKKPIVERDRVQGVVTNRGELRAGLVVDASGPRHWLARKLNLPMQFYSPPLYGYYNWARGHCRECAEQPLIYTDPQGWVWLSRVGPDLYQCTRMSFTREADVWIPPQFAEMTFTGPQRTADFTWRIVRQLAGPGYFLLGDAARSVDLLRTRGMQLGMQEALELADGLDQEKYARTVRDRFLKTLESSYEWLRAHPRAPEWTAKAYFREAAAQG